MDTEVNVLNNDQQGYATRSRDAMHVANTRLRQSPLKESHSLVEIYKNWAYASVNGQAKKVVAETRGHSKEGTSW